MSMLKKLIDRFYAVDSKIGNNASDRLWDRSACFFHLFGVTCMYAVAPDGTVTSTVKFIRKMADARIMALELRNQVIQDWVLTASSADLLKQRDLERGKAGTNLLFVAQVQDELDRRCGGNLRRFG